MWRNGVYPCEYMNNWDFYNNLVMESIKDADYKHANVLKESGKTLDYKI